MGECAFSVVQTNARASARVIRPSKRFPERESQKQCRRIDYLWLVNLGDTAELETCFPPDQTFL